MPKLSIIVVERDRERALRIVDGLGGAEGHQIAVISEETRLARRITELKPDIVLILPWNLKEEIVAAHGYIREWGGRFAVPIPRVEFVA